MLLVLHPPSGVASSSLQTYPLCIVRDITTALPKRDSAERFPELDLELNNVRLIDARMFSMALVNSGSNQWREFFRITMPREKVARREHIAYIMRNELERRRRGVATFGGGRRVSVTDLTVTPLYATHRKAYARELALIYAFEVLGMISLFFKEFRKQNQEWVNERLKVTDVHKQIILGKKVIESLNKQRPFRSAYHLASELHELPASVGHSVFFCIARKDLTLSIGKEEIVRKYLLYLAKNHFLDDFFRLTQLSTRKKTVDVVDTPSSFHTNGNTLVPLRLNGHSTDTVKEKRVSSKAECSEPLAISVHEAPRRAPSVNSLSGFSSESGASTATESPGEWQHNWKMQTMHRDMEHRLMDNSIQNPLQEKQLGELEAAQRIADEVDRRIALLNNPQQIGTLCSGKFDEFSQYYRNVFSENPIKLRRNKTTVAHLKNEIKRILAFTKSFDVSKAEDCVPIQVADYAHNEMIRMIPTNGGDPYDG
uniref:ERCC4 domain-containing protein n=1 Tax=Angiostrongylus cantonensis TaxID=6313 RepID=A0A0K0DEP2_ANGCA